VSSQGAILGRQILVAQQQLLIDSTCHEGQKACPMKSDRT
jgi:hypothetical protein